MYRKTESLSQAMYRLNPTTERDADVWEGHIVYIYPADRLMIDIC